VHTRSGAAFEFALFTSDAPATVLRFVHMAEAGMYKDSVIGVSREHALTLGEAATLAPGPPPPNETGPWPHVRGSVGFAASRGSSSGQIEVRLVDDPAADHERAVFGQVLTGMDVVEGLPPGDRLDRIDVLLR
jgi:cyclophilin family peptidyl-prolyl cis-trans isomerase